MDESERIPDDALVVRGGRPPSDKPLTVACDNHPDGYYGFSVQSGPGLQVADLGRALRNKRVGVTTVGEIRKLGYDVVRTSGEGFHATLVVPPDWDEADAELLARLFQEAKNPYPKSTR